MHVEDIVGISPSMQIAFKTRQDTTAPRPPRSSALTVEFGKWMSGL